MKEQCFFVWEVKRGRGVADLSRDSDQYFSKMVKFHIFTVVLPRVLGPLPMVTLCDITPSPQYYHGLHPHYRGFSTAPAVFQRPHYHAVHYTSPHSGNSITLPVIPCYVLVDC